MAMPVQCSNPVLIFPGDLHIYKLQCMELGNLTAVVRAAATTTDGLASLFTGILGAEERAISIQLIHLEVRSQSVAKPESPPITKRRLGRGPGEIKKTPEAPGQEKKGKGISIIHGTQQPAIAHAELVVLLHGGKRLLATTEAEAAAGHGGLVR